MKKQNQTKYKHLITWGKMMGSHQYYIDQQIEHATRLNAPENTIYFRGEKPVTFDKVTNPEVIDYFNRFF